MRSSTKLALAFMIVTFLPQGARAVQLEVTDSDLVLWLRTDSVVTNAAVVEEWIDLAAGSVGDGVAQNALLTDGGPTIVNNAINGRPSVNFGGGGAYEFTGPLGISGQAAFTILGVVKQEGGGTTERLLQIGAITPHVGGESVAAESKTPSLRYNNGNNLFENDTFTQNEFELGLWRMNSSDTYGTSQFALQGEFRTPSGATNPGNTINLVDEGYSLGKGIDGGGDNNDILSAEVTEVLLYKRSLDQADLDKAEFYLRHRYSLDFQAVDLPDVDMNSLANISAGPAPAEINIDAQQSNNDAVVFLEQEKLFLPADVDVNIDGTPGDYTIFDSIAETLEAGTLVNSYYMSFDPVNNSGTAIVQTMEIAFDEEILGIATTNSEVISSTGLLGLPGTLYELSNPGLENNGSGAADGDFLTIGPDGRSLTVRMRVGGSNVDQIRILTRPTPEPSSIVLLGFGALAISSLCRRRRRA